MSVDKFQALKDAALCVLYGVRPYPTGTDTLPDRSIVETWRIRLLGEALRKLNTDIEDQTPEGK